MGWRICSGFRLFGRNRKSPGAEPGSKHPYLDCTQNHEQLKKDHGMCTDVVIEALKPCAWVFGFRLVPTEPSEKPCDSEHGPKILWDRQPRPSQLPGLRKEDGSEPVGWHSIGA